MQKDYKKSQNSESKKDQDVTVFVRKSSKRTIMLNLPSSCKMSNLQQKVFQELKIPAEDQVFFINGKLIPPTQKQVNLEHQCIIHLLDKKRVNQEKITVMVKKNSKDAEVQKFTLSSKQKISFILDRLTFDVNDSNFFLIYRGRELKASKTFRQEYIEDQSQLFCLEKEKNEKVKTIQSSNIQQPPPNSSQTFALVNYSLKKKHEVLKLIQHSQKIQIYSSQKSIKRSFSFKKDKIEDMTNNDCQDKKNNWRYELKQEKLKQEPVILEQRKMLINHSKQDQLDSINCSRKSLISSSDYEGKIYCKEDSSPDDSTQQAQNLLKEEGSLQRQTIEKMKKKQLKYNFRQLYEQEVDFQEISCNNVQIKKTCSEQYLEKIEQQEESAVKGQSLTNQFRINTKKFNQGHKSSSGLGEGEYVKKVDKKKKKSQQSQYQENDDANKQEYQRNEEENIKKVDSSQNELESNQRNKKQNTCLLTQPSNLKAGEKNEFLQSNYGIKTQILIENKGQQHHKNQGSFEEEDDNFSIDYLEKIHGKIDEEDDETFPLKNIILGKFGKVPSSLKRIPHNNLTLSTTNSWENIRMRQGSQTKNRMVENFQDIFVKPSVVRKSQA